MATVLSKELRYLLSSFVKAHFDCSGVLYFKVTINDEPSVKNLIDRFLYCCDKNILSLSSTSVCRAFGDWFECQLAHQVQSSYGMSRYMDMSFSNAIQDAVIGFGLLKFLYFRAKFWRLIRSPCNKLGRSLTSISHKPSLLIEYMSGCITASDLYHIDEVIGCDGTFSEIKNLISGRFVDPVALGSSCKACDTVFANDEIYINKTHFDELLSNSGFKVWFIKYDGVWVFRDDGVNLDLNYYNLQKYILGVFFDIFPQIGFQTLSTAEWMVFIKRCFMFFLAREIRDYIAIKGGWLSVTRSLKMARIAISKFVTKMREFLRFLVLSVRICSAGAAMYDHMSKDYVLRVCRNLRSSYLNYMQKNYKVLDTLSFLMNSSPSLYTSKVALEHFFALDQ